MADYRLLFDSDYLYAFHLQGKDVTVRIARVTGGELVGEGGRKSKKPLVYFEGKEKPLPINKTNGKAIAGMYGADTKEWIGKYVTLFPTTTQFGGETKECIRVRPQVPRVGSDAQSPKAGAEKKEEPREPGSEG